MVIIPLALLVDAAGNVLLEAENTVNTEHDCTGHAETNLVRLASRKFERDVLEGCTLYQRRTVRYVLSAIHWSGW